MGRIWLKKLVIELNQAHVLIDYSCNVLMEIRVEQGKKKRLGNWTPEGKLGK